MCWKLSRLLLKMKITSTSNSSFWLTPVLQILDKLLLSVRVEKEKEKAKWSWHHFCPWCHCCLPKPGSDFDVRVRNAAVTGQMYVKREIAFQLCSSHFPMKTNIAQAEITWVANQGNQISQNALIMNLITCPTERKVWDSWPSFRGTPTGFYVRPQFA